MIFIFAEILKYNFDGSYCIDERERLIKRIFLHVSAF